MCNIKNSPSQMPLYQRDFRVMSMMRRTGISFMPIS